MRETPSQELINLVLHGCEERYLEYKESTAWEQRDAKIELTRCILGMANLRDGGFIVLGVEQRGDDFVPVGMQSEHTRSFSQDRVDDYVRDHADPFVETKVTRVSHDGKEFIVIQIREFEELPAICRKDAKRKDGEQRLREGAIYVRSRGKSEVAEVPTQTEMREIIELAVDKRVRHFIERIGRVGLLSLLAEPSELEKFNRQLGEMK